MDVEGGDPRRQLLHLFRGLSQFGRDQPEFGKGLLAALAFQDIQFRLCFFDRLGQFLPAGDDRGHVAAHVGDLTAHVKQKNLGAQALAEQFFPHGQFFGQNLRLAGQGFVLALQAVQVRLALLDTRFQDYAAVFLGPLIAVIDGPLILHEGLELGVGETEIGFAPVADGAQAFRNNTAP